MTPRTETSHAERRPTGRQAVDFLALTRPRVALMVLVTTFVGFYLGSSGAVDAFLLLKTLLGMALAAGGTLTLNQYLERDVDARMERTRLRPLPDGRLQPPEALIFGALALGIAFLGGGIGLAISRSEAAARRLLFASLMHLPVLFLFMALDKLPF